LNRETADAANNPIETVPAGALPPWEVSQLPPPPLAGWRGWLMLLGPGVLLAGASVGTGEWLFGPAVSAQYGGTLLWLATLSIVFQVFCNLEFMRYALYCGEPILVGGMRTKPGPLFWVVFFLLLDSSAVWPYNASNAAVPLASAILGHLPRDGAWMIGDNPVVIFGRTLTEANFVKGLGFAIFFAAFLPLIFGGTIYRMLERLMALKLLVVLTFLGFVAIFLISAPTVREVLTGFVRFGTVPLRAETVIAGPHFTYSRVEPGAEGDTVFTVKGTLVNGGADPGNTPPADAPVANADAAGPVVTEFVVTRGEESTVYKSETGVPEELRPIRADLVRAAVALARPGRFLVRNTSDGATVEVEGTIAENQAWLPEQFIVEQDGKRETFDRIEDVPEPYAKVLAQYVEFQGLKHAGIVSYWRENGRLPPLDWAMLAAFAAIAGAGGMTNAMFSNYARDKGWGMGREVGAIPSAVGGIQVGLSHVGKVFRLNPDSLAKWRGWMRHVVKDQLVVWMFCSFVGMALPCMLSIEFIRNAPVSGDRAAAMTAEGIANRYPDFHGVLWFTTLFVGFLVLAPGQMVAGDILARRWTDIIWNYSKRAKRMGGHQVKNVYYGILAIYAVWGFIALSLFDPLMTAKIGAVTQNVALGATALMALYVNCTLLPKDLRPNMLMKVGTLLCGVFFLLVTLVVIVTL
jgi:hypothetical protein